MEQEKEKTLLNVERLRVKKRRTCLTLQIVFDVIYLGPVLRLVFKLDAGWEVFTEGAEAFPRSPVVKSSKEMDRSG